MLNLVRIILIIVPILTCLNATAETPIGRRVAVDFQEQGFLESAITPGPLNLRTVLRANTDCTGIVRYSCVGGFSLAVPSDSLISFALAADSDWEYVLPVELGADAGYSRVYTDVEIVGDGSQYILQNSQHVTTIPEQFYSGTRSAEVGFYFDEAAQINCLSDSTTYPIAVLGYLILTNYSESSRVIGWEGRLDWDPNLFVTLNSYSGAGSINVEAFPGFLVGCSEPLPLQGTVQLASFTVIALGPGRIFFEGLGGAGAGQYPSIITETTAVPLPLSYSVGGGGAPVATVGDIDCPTSGPDSLFLVADSRPGGGDSTVVEFVIEDAESGNKQERSLHVSGKLSYINLTPYTSHFGAWGARVRLFFVEAPDRLGLFHPVSTINGLVKNVHYDIADEQGYYEFQFDFDNSIPLSKNAIYILVETENDKVHMPMPDDGLYTRDRQGNYTYYYNPFEGVRIPNVDPQAASFNYVNIVGTMSRRHAHIYRCVEGAVELSREVYGGTSPFGDPGPIDISIVPDTGEFSGLYYNNCGGGVARQIQINESFANSGAVNTVAHEYGHYLHHYMWDFDCVGWGSPPTNQPRHTVKEGFATFFAVAVKNYFAARYNDYSWFGADYNNAEESPFFSNTRYKHMQYQEDYPYVSAFACYLYNLYDGVEDGFFEPAVYYGDNDDVSVGRARVFEALDELEGYTYLPWDVAFRDLFNEGLDDDVQESCDAIYEFMMEDLSLPPNDVEMRPVQTTFSGGTGLTSTNSIEFYWSRPEYGNRYYANPCDGVSIYKLNQLDNWSWIYSLDPFTFNYSLWMPNGAAGIYKITSVSNIAGTSCSPDILETDVAAVSAPVGQKSRIIGISPNPANPIARVSFTVGTEDVVEITIYSVRGTRVRTLVKDVYEPGRYEVVWYGDSENGENVSSGTYFCRMKNGEMEDVRRLLLLK